MTKKGKDKKKKVLMLGLGAVAVGFMLKQRGKAEQTATTQPEQLGVVAQTPALTNIKEALQRRIEEQRAVRRPLIPPMPLAPIAAGAAIVRHRQAIAGRVRGVAGAVRNVGRARIAGAQRVAGAVGDRARAGVVWKRRQAARSVDRVRRVAGRKVGIPVRATQQANERVRTVAGRAKTRTAQTRERALENIRSIRRGIAEGRIPDKTVGLIRPIKRRVGRTAPIVTTRTREVARVGRDTAGRVVRGARERTGRAVTLKRNIARRTVARVRGRR